MTIAEKQSNHVEPAMTELGAHLRGPEGKQVAAAVLERFTKLNKDLEAQKKNGLTPDKFAATEALLKAVAAASETVVAFTQFHHSTSHNTGNDG